ncbi:MAG: 8-oxoguanine deaminase, partial [Candidatus Cloacimonetes bacterium]|nr:8-oxoguanine deaminase [Candidatus Cloacimonadota bacterium]
MKVLFKNISFLYTFRDDNCKEDAYILLDDNIIEEIGNGRYEGEVEKEFDCRDYLIMPGFINIHHHFYQSLFRNVKAVQSAKLFDWLTYLYEKWKYIDEEAVFISTIIANLEMIKSGVTTSTDHLYLYPHGNNNLFDTEIEAARETGIRFYPTRGSMSLSKKDGGLPPDSVVQSDDEIMQESERVVNQYHDPSPHSMLRVGLAPCSPFSVTDEIMKQTAEYSRKNDIMIHTHLAETSDEEEFCLEKVGMRPVDYLDDLGWLNERSWLVHLVWLNEYDRKKLINNNCGMAHCPSSNMRLGSGIAPVSLLKNKMRIGLGIDGSASNDTNNMLSEIRRAMLLQRVKYGADAITPYEALQFATVGGAEVLNIDDYVGTLAPGMSADFIGFDLNRIEFAGGLSDPLGALVLCDAKQVD